MSTLFKYFQFDRVTNLKKGKYFKDEKGQIHYKNPVKAEVKQENNYKDHTQSHSNKTKQLEHKKITDKQLLKIIEENHFSHQKSKVQKPKAKIINQIVIVHDEQTQTQQEQPKEKKIEKQRPQSVKQNDFYCPNQKINSIYRQSYKQNHPSNDNYQLTNQRVFYKDDNDYNQYYKWCQRQNNEKLLRQRYYENLPQ